MQEKKLIVATGLYPPDIGGPATYAVLLEKELPAQGVTVTTVPFSLVRRFPKVVRHLVFTWRLWRASKEGAVLLALDPISVGLPALFVAKLRRLPLLVRLGGDYAWEQGRQRFGVEMTLDEYTQTRRNARWPVRVLHKLQTFVTKRAQKVIVPSAYLERIVRTWGVSPEKIEVIHSVVQVPKPKEDKATARRRLGLSGFVVVTAARLTPWKGVAMLIECVAQLRQQGLAVTLCIAGDGPQRDALETLVQDATLEPHVHFLGQLPKNELYDYLYATDLFALNTAYEGLSHQLLEAMLLHTPVVTTPVGGNTELITDTQTGHLVAYNDVAAWTQVLSNMYADQARATAYASNAFTHATTTFAPRASLEATAKLIHHYGH